MHDDPNLLDLKGPKLPRAVGPGERKPIAVDLYRELSLFGAVKLQSMHGHEVSSASGRNGRGEFPPLSLNHHLRHVKRRWRRFLGPPFEIERYPHHRRWQSPDETLDMRQPSGTT
jgi:hypothetical protein